MVMNFSISYHLDKLLVNEQIARKETVFVDPPYRIEEMRFIMSDYCTDYFIFGIGFYMSGFSIDYTALKAIPKRMKVFR